MGTSTPNKQTEFTHRVWWHLGLQQKEAIWFYVIVAPWIFGFIVFTAGPMIASFIMSLTDWDLFSTPNYVGFENYIRLFTQDKVFVKALYNTFFYAILSVPLNLTASILIAYLLNKPLRGTRFYRILFYLPAVVSPVAMSMLFRWVFAPDTGVLNRFLAIFGVDGPHWLFDAAAVKPALIIMSLWSIGSFTVLLLSGFRGIPVEFYEAATVDGASELHCFFKITLPMLSPIIFFNLVMGIIGSLQTFVQVFVLTSGGPNNASMMIVPYLFNHAFSYYHMGYAAAIAWVLFIIVMLLTIIVFKSSSLWVFYESEIK